MNYTFPKNKRLVKHIAYQEIYQTGKRYRGGKIFIYFRRGNFSTTKLGITIGRKWGKANTRNRFKRITKEAFRLCYPLFPNFLEINVHPLPLYQSLTSKEIQEEFNAFIRQLK